MDSLGGGYKINLFRTALEPYKDDTEKIVLFTDSYDVVFTTTLDVIVHKFKKLNARILFGAEKFVWPDETVEHLYPSVAKLLPKYLNSGLFMGKSHFSLHFSLFVIRLDELNNNNRPNIVLHRLRG